MYHLSLLPLDTFVNAWLYDFGKHQTQRQKKEFSKLYESRQTNKEICIVLILFCLSRDRCRRPHRRFHHRHSRLRRLLRRRRLRCRFRCPCRRRRRRRRRQLSPPPTPAPSRKQQFANATSVYRGDLPPICHGAGGSWWPWRRLEKYPTEPAVCRQPLRRTQITSPLLIALTRRRPRRRTRRDNRLPPRWRWRRRRP